VATHAAFSRKIKKVANGFGGVELEHLTRTEVSMIHIWWVKNRMDTLSILGQNQKN